MRPPEAMVLSPSSLVWAPGCDGLRLHSWVRTAHAQVALCVLNGLAIFFDMSQGGGRGELPFESPRRPDRKWELWKFWVSKLGTGSNPPPQKNEMLNVACQESLKRKFHFWVELCFNKPSHRIMINAMKCPVLWQCAICGTDSLN